MKIKKTNFFLVQNSFFFSAKKVNNIFIPNYHDIIQRVLNCLVLSILSQNNVWKYRTKGHEQVFWLHCGWFYTTWYDCFWYFWPVSWLVLLDLASGEHCRGRWIVGQSSLFLWCPSGKTLVPLTGVQALFSENKK